MDISEEYGDFILRGVTTVSLPRDRKWEFAPAVEVGDTVQAGDIIGEVAETQHISHKIMVPPGKSGRVAEIKEGEFTVVEKVCRLEDGTEIGLMQTWPAACLAR